jgi:hypothetical protein
MKALKMKINTNYFHLIFWGIVIHILCAYPLSSTSGHLYYYVGIAGWWIGDAFFLAGFFCYTRSKQIHGCWSLLAFLSIFGLVILVIAGKVLGGARQCGHM